MTAHKRKTDSGKKILAFRRRMKNGYQLILLFAIFLLACLIVSGAEALGSNVINSEKNAVFEDAWQCRVGDGDFSKVILPASERLPADSRITLKNHLPLQMVKGATVMLRTSQQDVEVIVGDTEIYNSRDGKDGIPSSSSAYHFVRLPTDCAAKPIAVILSSPFANYAGLMNQIYIGSKASNLFFLLHENGMRLIIGFLIFSVGFLLMVMFLFTKGKEGRAPITDLGAFFVCAGYWVMAESRMLQFFIPYPMAITNSSVFALTLIPVFFGLYYYGRRTNAHKKIEKGMVVMLTIASFAFAVAACTNPMLPIEILPFYSVLLALYLLVLFAFIFTESIKSGKFFSISVCGIVSFGVCALVELILYLSNTSAYNKSDFITLGLLLFCIFMVADSTRNFSRVYRNAIKVDALSVLAYVDSLTGLKNRTAFLEELSSVEVNGESFVTIAMYDINNLKITNDTKGHLVGDALLWHCAKAIKLSLRHEDKVFRIGGDEFVAIILHEPSFDVSGLEERLLSIEQRENSKPLSYTLSVAYGFATFSKSTDKTLFDTQARADASMYACKRLQKAELKPPAAEEENEA